MVGLTALAVVGVMVGTIFGLRWLRTLEGRSFRIVVSLTVMALGVYMILKAL